VVGGEEAAGKKRGELKGMASERSVKKKEGMEKGRKEGDGFLEVKVSRTKLRKTRPTRREVMIQGY